MNSILLITTTLFAGLLAGLFYAWSVSVTPGIGRTDTKTYLTSFQSMNRAILNPVFFIVFMGILPLLAGLSYVSRNSENIILIGAASLVYLFGVMFVTINGNIPLNNNLEALKINKMSDSEMETFRQKFERKWNRYNLIRTFSSAATALLLIIANNY